MMRKLLFILLTLCLFYKIQAQTTDSTWLTDRAWQEEQLFIPGVFSQMDVDALGNIYVMENKSIKKYNSSGQTIGVFNDVKRLGQPTTFDVSNPLKTIVFYKSYGTIVVLDNMMTQRVTLNTRRFQFLNVVAAAVSYDNELWIFDEQDYKLKKITEQGRLLMESNDLRLFVSFPIKVKRIFDVDPFIYLQDEENGLVVLDKYGAFQKVIPFVKVQNITFASPYIYGYDGRELKRYHALTTMTDTYSITDKWANIKTAYAHSTGLYLLDDTGVHLYKY